MLVKLHDVCREDPDITEHQFAPVFQETKLGTQPSAPELPGGVWFSQFIPGSWGVIHAKERGRSPMHIPLPLDKGCERGDAVPNEVI